MADTDYWRRADLSIAQPLLRQADIRSTQAYSPANVMKLQDMVNTRGGVVKLSELAVNESGNK